MVHYPVGVAGERVAHQVARKHLVAHRLQQLHQMSGNAHRRPVAGHRESEIDLHALSVCSHYEKFLILYTVTIRS